MGTAKHLPNSQDSGQVTPARFIEDWPLYRTWSGQWSTPQTVSLECSLCGRETSWGTDGSDYVGNIGYFNLYVYTCHLCSQRKNYYVLYRVDKGVMKIGQFPSQSINVPASIEQRLGGSAIFYRRALTSRNQGFGLAAVAYFRRVIEDKTNELVDVVADSAESMGLSAEEVANIRAAKSEKRYEDKLKFAAQAIPSLMKPDGANPLQALYELLSGGLHTQTEEECLQIADDVLEIFDYLFNRLRGDIEDRKSFVAKVKKMVGKRSS
jgi:hypothetical protein